MTENTQPRCGKCPNCAVVEQTKKRVLACCGTPKPNGGINHADDGVVQVWNDTLRDFPCTGNQEGAE